MQTVTVEFTKKFMGKNKLFTVEVLNFTEAKKLLEALTGRYSYEYTFKTDVVYDKENAFMGEEKIYYKITLVDIYLDEKPINIRMFSKEILIGDNF